MTSTTRSLRILLLFSPEAPSLSAQEIAAATGATLSTVYRDLGNLRDLGFVESYPGERFGLGGGISVLDRLARLMDPLRRAALAEMQRLSAETGLTVTLTRLYGTRLLGVDHVEGRTDISIGYERGQLVPLFRGCSGKVILGGLGWRRLKTIHTACADEIAGLGLGADWPGFLAGIRALSKEPALWTHGEVMPGNSGVAVELDGAPYSFSASMTVLMREADLPGIDRPALETALIAARDRARETLKQASADQLPG